MDVQHQYHESRIRNFNLMPTKLNIQYMMGRRTAGSELFNKKTASLVTYVIKASRLKIKSAPFVLVKQSVLRHVTVKSALPQKTEKERNGGKWRMSNLYHGQFRLLRIKKGKVHPGEGYNTTIKYLLKIYFIRRKLNISTHSQVRLYLLIFSRYWFIKCLL